MVAPRGLALGLLDLPSCRFKYHWGLSEHFQYQTLLFSQKVLSLLVAHDSNRPSLFYDRAVPSLRTLWPMMKGMEFSTLNKDQRVGLHTYTTKVRLPLLHSLLLLLSFSFFSFSWHLCTLVFAVQFQVSDSQEVISSFLMWGPTHNVFMAWLGRRIAFQVRFPCLW